MTRQLSGGTATVATGRDVTSPFPPSGPRVTYVTETFPFSRSLRVTSDDRRNWDLHREGQLLLFLEQPKQ